MKLINCANPDKPWKLDTVLSILTKLESWTLRHNLHNVTVLQIEDNTWEDKANQRYDIEIMYNGTWQKLIMLQGKVMDGKEFHRNFTKYYERKG